mmetsp:Transcript_11471/g.29394  ORF Transcript_11471/g.29394 Transcript_11471/m.29394 type:complete len:221 (-) Transcript_11471:1142-1804(-)
MAALVHKVVEQLLRARAVGRLAETRLRHLRQHVGCLPVARCVRILEVLAGEGEVHGRPVSVAVDRPQIEHGVCVPAMSAILKRQARRREVLHNALAVEVHHADAVGSRRQTRLRRLVEPALRGLKVLCGYTQALQVHVAKVKHGVGVALRGRRLKLPHRVLRVGLHPLAQQAAEAQVALRLSAAAPRHVLLHLHLVLPVLHLVRVHVVGVQPAVAKAHSG